MRPGRAPVTDATAGMRHARAAGRAVSHRLQRRLGPCPQVRQPASTGLWALRPWPGTLVDRRWPRSSQPGAHPRAGDMTLKFARSAPPRRTVPLYLRQNGRPGDGGHPTRVGLAVTPKRTWGRTVVLILSTDNKLIGLGVGQAPRAARRRTASRGVHHAHLGLHRGRSRSVRRRCRSSATSTARVRRQCSRRTTVGWVACWSRPPACRSPRHGFHSIAEIRSESPALDLRHPAAVRSIAAVEERSP